MTDILELELLDLITVRMMDRGLIVLMLEKYLICCKFVLELISDFLSQCS